MQSGKIRPPMQQSITIYSSTCNDIDVCQKCVPIVDCALNTKYSSSIFYLLFLFFYVLFIKSCQGRPYVDLLRNKVFLGSRMLVGGRSQRRGKDPRLCERNGRCTSLVLKSLEKGK